MTARTLLLIAVAAVAAGCGSDRRPPPPKMVVTATVTDNPSKASAKDLPAILAVNAAVAGAKAGTEPITAPVAPPPAPAVTLVGGTKSVSVSFPTKPAPKPIVPAIKLHLKSDRPHESRDRALDDALVVAQIEIMKELQRSDPAIAAKPSLAKIRAEYLKKDTVKDVLPTDADKADFAAAKLSDKMFWVEIDVELSETQVQQLRAGERVGTGFRGAGLLFAAIAAAYGFFRLDAWTKGYLTLWLGLGAAAVVAVAAAVALL